MRRPVISTMTRPVRLVSPYGDGPHEIGEWPPLRSEQAALLWLAACRAYRFIGEFALEVLNEPRSGCEPNLVPTSRQCSLAEARLLEFLLLRC